MALTQGGLAISSVILFFHGREARQDARAAREEATADRKAFSAELKIQRAECETEKSGLYKEYIGALNKHSDSLVRLTSDTLLTMRDGKASDATIAEEIKSLRAETSRLANEVSRFSGRAA